MASTKIIQEKQNVVEEITKKLDDSKSVILFSYQGLSVADIADLRKELRNNDSEVKIYKNTYSKYLPKRLFYIGECLLNEIFVPCNLYVCRNNKRWAFIYDKGEKR